MQSPMLRGVSCQKITCCNKYLCTILSTQKKKVPSWNSYIKLIKKDNGFIELNFKNETRWFLDDFVNSESCASSDNTPLGQPLLKNTENEQPRLSINKGTKDNFLDTLKKNRTLQQNKTFYHSNKANIAVKSHFQFSILMDCIKIKEKFSRAF